MNKEFLRHLQLFENLSEADLDWLLAQAESVEIPRGEDLIEEGKPGDAAYVILDGEFEVVKKSDVQNIVIAVREPGEVFGEMALLDRSPRTATVHAVRDSRVLKIRGETFQQLLAQSSSAALSILQTVSKRLRQNEGLLRQNEKMAALGTLAAGLAHELNNPASAVRRSADQLQSALSEWSQASSELERLRLDEQQLRIIHNLRGQLETLTPSNPSPDPLALSDAEAEIQSWLEEHHVENAWEHSSALVSFGWKIGALNELTAAFEPQAGSVVVQWLASGSTAYFLLHEVNIGTQRISEIVKSVKAYSYLDQAPIQDVDVQEGLENTLVILRHKTKDGIKITRDYSADLPHIEAHGSELNQVWTNILDNAIDAMQGRGELILRAYPRDGKVIVEIEDNGPGIPPEIRQRIFEPFFTTKPPGQGTGLGLHIAYTIVNNHYGQIRVSSEAGKTCFQVTLPVRLPR
ncbi:MAG TPA: ATP-binding protein [Anaerolineales bacterium]|nr:ATP-binding protein [Anaerolineales bacterium]